MGRHDVCRPKKFDGEFRSSRDVVLHRRIGMWVRHVGTQLVCEFESGLVLDVDDTQLAASATNRRTIPFPIPLAAPVTSVT